MRKFSFFRNWVWDLPGGPWWRPI